MKRVRQRSDVAVATADIGLGLCYHRRQLADIHGRGGFLVLQLGTLILLQGRLVRRDRLAELLHVRCRCRSQHPQMHVRVRHRLHGI